MSVAAPAALFQLPVDVRTFTDRERELKEIAESARKQGALYVVSGMPGVGKTTFAVHLAHELSHFYPDAQLYLDLRGYDSALQLMPRHILPAVAGAFGVPAQALPKDVNEQATLYRSLLASKRAVILLDNARSEEQVRLLLPGSSTCLVVVTSRSRLPGLIATYGARLIELHPFATADSVTLLARIGGNDRIASQPALARALARLCGGLPLALGVVAARLANRRSLTLGELCDQLGEEERRLQELKVGDVEVRASINLSYQHLSPDDARLFRLLGLFPVSDLSFGACAALAGLSANELRPSLDRLADANLVDIGSSPPRLRIHDLVRIFARERLMEDDEQTRVSALARLLDWYLAMAGTAEGLIIKGRKRAWESPPIAWGMDPPTSRMEALSWFESERLNLVTACHEANRAGLHPFAWKIADAAWAFFQLRKYWADWDETHRIGLESAVAISDAQAQAWMLTGLGGVQWEIEEYDQALGNLNQAVELHTTNHDLNGLTRALMNLSFAYGHMGRHAESIECGEKALRISRELNDRYRMAWTLYSLATSHIAIGRLEAAIEYCTEALSIWLAVDDRVGEGFCRNSIGTLLRRMGKYEESIAEIELALNAAREMLNAYGEGMTLDNLAQTYHAMGRRAEALSLWQQSLEILVRINAPEARDLEHRLAELARD